MQPESATYRNISRNKALECRFNAGLGVFQFLCLLGGIQQLAPAVCGVFTPHQRTLGLQMGGPPGSGALIDLQSFPQFCLGDAGIMTNQMDEVKLCCSPPPRA